MRIAALSDFHIGATDETDCFRHDTRDFCRFLDDLESEHDRIVLLGDIFQSDYGAAIGKRTERRELARAQGRRSTLWSRFQNGRYVYVHGNHDAVAATYNGALTGWRVSSDGFAVYFVHGHQFDPLLRTIYPLARASTWFSGRIRRLGLREVADWLEEKDVSIKHERFQGDRGPYAEGARHLLRSQRVDAVIMGHTHVPTCIDLGEGIYANTGTCSHGQVMYVSIDTKERSVRCL